MLSDQETMDALIQLGPLGDRKPSQLLASMLTLCPQGLSCSWSSSTSSYSGFPRH